MHPKDIYLGILLVHYKEVILAIYNYISVLRASDIERYHYDELHTMSELHFRFREKTKPHTYVNDLSYQLSEFSPEDVLSGDTVIREWDEFLFKETLKSLDPERGRVLLTAKVHDEAVVGHDVQWELEKWYGVEYRVTMLGEVFINQVRIDLPGSSYRSARFFIPIFDQYSRRKHQTRMRGCFFHDPTLSFQLIFMYSVATPRRYVRTF